jgi:hypothetical protein
METLEDTLIEINDWSRERIHVLCENKNEDDAFSIFKEFEEWYDEDVDDHKIFSMEYIGEGSEFD